MIMLGTLWTVGSVGGSEVLLGLVSGTGVQLEALIVAPIHRGLA